MTTHDDLLWESPALRPVAPLVLAAWQDGLITPAELLEIRERLEKGPWLDRVQGQALSRWLDAERPPAPQRLRRLEREVQKWLQQVSPAARRSLRSFSVALAGENLAEPEREAARSLLEQAEGIVQARDFERGGWHGGDERPARIAWPAYKDRPRVRALRRMLDSEATLETRDFVRELLGEADFRAERGLDTRAYRGQVLTWLKQVIDAGVVERCYPDGLAAGRDVRRFVAAFETLAMFDLSLVVKFGVQVGLFAGTVEQLGTERHRETRLRGLGGELLGCFAMTERGHGSNVRGLCTRATYDPAEACFVIDTPSLAAGKEWIGNAADDGRMAVVFAQLSTLDECYGVHAFLVPIRQADGSLAPGVRIEDCGPKMGLNGVDNGRLWFDSVRVPRDALLDRFGQVEENGEYHSPIPSSGKRFFMMLSTLVGGRVAVAGAANSAAKVGLSIALRYAVQRTQFEGADGAEQPLMAYHSHRMRLLPRLAATYAFSFAQHQITDALHRADTDQAADLDVDTLAAGVKALATWQAIDTLQQCRECCGGQGYLTANRIDALRTDTDVFTTFEGDNTVLLSLVANNLLREYQRALQHRPVRTLIGSLVEDVGVAVTERNPWSQRDSSEESLRSLDLHAAALRFREKSLLSSLTRRMRRRLSDGKNAQEAFDECQDHALAVARAHIEHFTFAAFREASEREPELEPLCALYGLWRIEADLAWFLENDFMAPARSRAVRDTLHGLLTELADGVLDWVDAFGIPPSCTGPLADPEYLRASGLTS